MNHKIKIWKYTIITFLAIVVLICIDYIHIRLASIEYAKRLSMVLASNQIEQFDNYFDSKSKIRIEDEVINYDDCRNNVMVACDRKESDFEEGSYGCYNKLFQDIRFIVNVPYKNTGVHAYITLKRKFGCFLYVDELNFPDDPYGILKSFFFGY